MWWLYFSEADHLETMETKRAFVWGYGHFVVFGAGATVGAGLGVMIDLQLDAVPNEAGSLSGPLAVSIPTAIYVAGLWLVRDRYMLKHTHGWVLLLFAVLIAATGLLPFAPISTALILIACLVIRLRSRRS